MIEAKLQARKAELERQVCIFRPLLSITGLFCRALLVLLRSGAQYEHSCYYPMSSRQERTQLRRMIESNSVYSGIGKGMRRTSMFKNGSGEGGAASSSSPGHRQVGSGSALLKATSSNQNNIV